ncbi:SAV_915 family protein [Rhodococcoides yunnanense]|uniref:SAV_915 family protein n=1 Tax=Rhodococcoides yunnanense TaxID=278209 RepID=UPI000AB28060|nr:SAV_915 family protein [Rhodococcus yunnanensis]
MIPSDFPPVLYVPCHERVSDPSDARVLLGSTRDGRSSLLAYSALDRLRTCMGGNQPWIVIPTSYLSSLKVVAPFELVLLDVVVPERARAS